MDQEQKPKVLVKVENPEEFPTDESLPEGCIRITGLKDDIGYALRCERVVYARRDSMELHLHIFEPLLSWVDTDADNKDKRWPLIVFVPGSGWYKQDMHGATDILLEMASRGYVVAAVEYRPSDIAAFPAQVEDCKTAIRYMRRHDEEFHANAEEIILWGESSGGHTALMAGFTGDDEPDTDTYRKNISAKVSCIIDWYGPTDLIDIGKYPSAFEHLKADSPEGYVLGRVKPQEHSELVKKASPLTYLVEDRPTPPTLIMHGSRDMVVPFHQSVILYEKMKQLNKDVTFMKVEDGNHGFGGFKSRKILDIVENYIKQKIKTL